jgi:DNA-binding transcriptional ArsR family regulator
MQADAIAETVSPLEAKADEVAATLAAMANPKRLLVLCTLLAGEKSVGDLAEIVRLSPAALSQHLGKMRALRLVATRRDGQTIFYSLASPEVRALLETLYRVYCAPGC